MANAQQLDGRNPLSYLGVESKTPVALTIQSRAPTKRDYKGYLVGDLWLQRPESDPETNVMHMLVRKIHNNSTGQIVPEATWINLNATGFTAIKGNTGGNIGPDGSDNINIISGFDPFTIDGNPGSNLLTINEDGTTPTSFPTDSGTATPSGNSLTLTGGTGIDTNGHMMGLTVSVDGTVPLTFNANTGSATAVSNEINILGGTDITTSGSGSTITITTSAGAATQFDADTGSATPDSAGVLNVLGGLNVNTSASGNSVTVNTDLLAEGVVYANSSGAFTSLGSGNDGQMLIGDTGGTPAWANLTSTGGSVTITNGSGSINLEATESSTSALFFAWLTTGQNVGTIIFDSELFDSNNVFNTSTGAFIAPQDGIYYLSTFVAVDWDRGSEDARSGVPFVNLTSSGGTAMRLKELYFELQSNNQSFAVGGNANIYLNSGDQVNISANVASIPNANNRRIIGGTNPYITWFTGYLIKAM